LLQAFGFPFRWRLSQPCPPPREGSEGYRGTAQPRTPQRSQLCPSPAHHRNSQNPLKVLRPHAREGRKGLVRLIKYR